MIGKKAAFTAGLGAAILLISGRVLAKLAGSARQGQRQENSQAAITPRALPSWTSIQDLLGLPEGSVDIGLYALTLAKEIYPSVDVAAYSAKIDGLAEEVRQLNGGSLDPDWRIRALNSVIFRDGKYHGSRDAVYNRKDDYFFLNRLLDTKRGSCFTMPLLYVAVAQRLGWPVYPVALPDHLFARYVDPSFHEQNIEATSGGAYIPDERYAKEFMVSKIGRQEGTYLRTMTYRELLGDLVTTNAVRFGKSGKMRKAIAYLNVAIQLNPKNDGAWANLAAANRAMAKSSTGTEAEKYLGRAAKCDKKLGELGFVPPWEVPLTPMMGGPAAAPRPPRTKAGPVAQVAGQSVSQPLSYSSPRRPLLPDGKPLNPDMTQTQQSPRPWAMGGDPSTRPQR